MSQFALEVKEEFKSYWNTAEKGRLADPTSQRSLIVSAHKYAKCFSTMSRAMGGEPEHRRIFLQELASDTMHLVHALLNGDARGARFYLRSVIENFWRHHYFRDHPVEYRWLHTRDKYYLEMRTLREHCGWLDCFQGELKLIREDLNRLYAVLSTAVHSTSSRTLVLREALADIRLSVEQTESIKRDLHAVLRACLALCMFSEHQTYFGLHINVQEFFKGTLSSREKTRLEKALVDSDLLS